MLIMNNMISNLLHWIFFLLVVLSVTIPYFIREKKKEKHNNLKSMVLLSSGVVIGLLTIYILVFLIF